MHLSRQDALVRPGVAPRTVPHLYWLTPFYCSEFYLKKSSLGGGQFTKPRGNTGETNVRWGVLSRRLIQL
jgi:hypothetical protein